MLIKNAQIAEKTKMLSPTRIFGSQHSANVIKGGASRLCQRLV